jgi:hypothetical protein
MDPTNDPVVVNPPAAPGPAVPPAAAVVKAGPETEATADLQRQLEEERVKRKQAEMAAGYAESEVQKLRDLQSGPPAAPRKRKETGWGFFRETED